MLRSVEDVRATIVGFICDELKLPAEQIADSTNLRELPGAESVKILRVIARIEHAFAIELDDEIVFRVERLDELVRAVSALTSEVPAS
jgi:acyl carrier protein